MYATYEDYTDRFRGRAIPDEADFDRLALRADAVLDRMTLGRAAKYRDRTGKLALACCAVAEKLWELEEACRGSAGAEIAEEKVAEHDKKIDFFVRTSLPPVEGIFYNGQIFDAYVFASDLIKSAKESIILIDNYIDESVLMMLAKRDNSVKARIITRNLNRPLMQDVERHNEQYAEIEILESSDYHDRFLIIDGTVYHLGASLKDLGKKLFAFSKMEIPAEKILPN